MTFKERWEAEETKIGKLFKYWAGYGLTTAGALIEAGDYLLTVYAKYSLATPDWLSHGLVGLGLFGYVVGKCTVKK